MSREPILRPGERVDDLERKGYRIIQNPSAFCFGMDAVLLSGFARVEPGERVLDLGTGTGVLPILMEARYGAGHYTALELQPEMAEMASRSVELNDLSSKITVVCGDFGNASEQMGKAAWDVVTSNPPYMKAGGGLVNPDPLKASARHETTATLEDLIRETARLLKPCGRFYLVHRPQRLSEILALLRSSKLEPKRLRLVHPFLNEEANLVLIESVRGGNVWMKAEPPLIVYEQPGVYTEEIRRIYYD